MMTFHLRYGKPLAASLILLGALAASVGGGNTALAQTKASSPTSDVALEGYCPVCIVEAKKWVRGNPRHQVTHDSRTYYFPSDKEKRMFEANPAKYVPALGGDCTVCYANAGKRVPGNIRHGVSHNGRLFLFPSDREKKEFLAHPRRYADVDLALDGKCAVCRVMVGKDVPGKPQFTAIHDGFRYQFPSDKERQVFLANPAKFTAERATGKQASTQMASKAAITIKGTSACAGCEHGVVPIGAPDTLGLAVNASDGKVYVVEDAHKLYPKVYEHRFDGLRLQVSGTVLKSDAKITWIKPTQLNALN